MKHSKHLLILSLVAVFGLLTASNVEAQLHVDAAGEVGIGTSSPSSRLDIRNTATPRSTYIYNNYGGTSTKTGLYTNMTGAGTGSRYGIYNRVTSHASSVTHYGLRNMSYFYNTTNGYGQYNYAYSVQGNGNRYGIYNYLNCAASDGTGRRYALYSRLGATCTGYAGYFSGDVYVSGTLTQTSDASKKTNIQAMNGALGIITQLQPKTYEYKFDEDLSLPEGKQYGFLAQELEQILPELVKNVDVLHHDNEGMEEGAKETAPESVGEIKTVNYMALIPILVQGMQEQQQTIAAQQAEIAAQNQRIADLEAKMKD